jgi:hypothetical protein
MGKCQKGVTYYLNGPHFKISAEIKIKIRLGKRLRINQFCIWLFSLRTLLTNIFLIYYSSLNRLQQRLHYNSHHYNEILLNLCFGAIQDEFQGMNIKR